MKALLTASASMICLAGFANAQTVIASDDFENGNPNGWSIDAFPSGGHDVAGGNPGGNYYDNDMIGNAHPFNGMFLPGSQDPAHVQGGTPNPAYLGASIDPHPYSGDFRALGADFASVDILQVAGGSPFGAGITLILGQEGGSPGILDDCIVWTGTGTFLQFTSGIWVTADASIPSQSMTLPSGWNAQTGPGNACGALMSDDDIWNSVIQDVDYVGFMIGDPFFPAFHSAELRFDNVLLTAAGPSGPGTNYCVTSPNSQGAGAVMSATGSTSIMANNLEISCGPIEPGQNGLFYYSDTAAVSPTGFAFGEGQRCVIAGGTGLVRLNPSVVADGTGTLTTTVDNMNMNQNAGIMVGATAYFQGWYRDPNCAGVGGPGDCNNDGIASGFNLSDGYAITFTM